MIKNIIFDLGGVIITLDQQQAIARFREIGVTDIDQWLDAYTQRGIFGELESGMITAEEFRQKLSLIVDRELTLDECEYAWRGYAKCIPERNLQKLEELKSRGYRLILLSNTNPFMIRWAESNEFDGKGKPITHYFDALYYSYKVRSMKPELNFFRHVAETEQIKPAETLFIDDGQHNVDAAATLEFHTFCPKNGADWTNELEVHLIE